MAKPKRPNSMLPFGSKPKPSATPDMLGAHRAPPFGSSKKKKSPPKGKPFGGDPGAMGGY